MEINKKVFIAVVDVVLSSYHEKTGELCPSSHVLQRMRDESVFRPSDDDVHDARELLLRLVAEGLVMSWVSGDDLLLNRRFDKQKALESFRVLKDAPTQMLVLTLAKSGVSPPRVVPADMRDYCARAIMDRAVGPAWAW